MFMSECELVQQSLPLLIKNFKKEGREAVYFQEPKGLFGIPDVIIYNGIIVSIEYKLKNWKQAMRQAYRYQSFSSETYVVLDKAYINSAKNNIDMFKKFNIGLAAAEHGKIEFYFKPRKKKPFNDELYKKAMDLFENSKS